jgi:hypothetical protein
VVTGCLLIPIRSTWIGGAFSVNRLKLSAADSISSGRLMLDARALSQMKAATVGMRSSIWGGRDEW